ncbi:hypothetical protein ABK040_014740 [Willaertia magna]
MSKTTTDSKLSWADQEEDGGIKIITEERIKDGKKVRIIKKVKVKQQKKINPIVEERRKWKKFGLAIDTSLGERDVTAIGEPIHFEPVNKTFQPTSIPTIADEKEQVLNKIQTQLAKEAESKIEEKKEEHVIQPTVQDKTKAGVYVPPSLRNKTFSDTASSSSGGGEVNRAIRVTNLDERATENDLRLLFGQVGKIIKVYLPAGYNGGNKGFALITYSTPEEAEEAIKRFDNFSLNHLLLSVEWSKQQRRF